MSSQVTNRRKAVTFCGNPRPIVAFAHHPWQEPEWMSRQQILSRLAKRGWPVAYSSGTLDMWQRGSARWICSPWFDTRSCHDGVFEIQAGRLGATWRRSPAFSKHAIARHSRFVRSTVAKANERVIAFLFDLQFYPYLEALQPCDVAFHAYDLFSGQPGWNDQKAAYQAALVKEASLLTASSETIARTLGGDKVRVLPNGADAAAFSNANSLPEPPDLHGIPHPRLGYVGAINRKVDLVLVQEIATRRPDWHWALVGRVDEDELLADCYNAPAFERCLSLPNVHFLGQKDRQAVPAYVGHMDVNTMCYRIDTAGWWGAGSPLKLHEYLACGLPVVSAPIEAVRAFSDVVWLADTTEAWIEILQRVLGTGTREASLARQAVAWANSWDSRVDQMESWLAELG